MGKHIDKLELDKEMGIRTLPVLLGERTTRYALKIPVTIAYLSVVGLVLAGVIPVWSVLTLLALPRALSLFRTLSSPRPREPRSGYQFWPIWFLGYVFSHNKRFGALYIGELVLGVLIPVYAPV